MCIRDRLRSSAKPFSVRFCCFSGQVYLSSLIGLRDCWGQLAEVCPPTSPSVGKLGTSSHREDTQHASNQRGWNVFSGWYAEPLDSCLFVGRPHAQVLTPEPGQNLHQRRHCQIPPATSLSLMLTAPQLQKTGWERGMATLSVDFDYFTKISPDWWCHVSIKEP